MKLFLFIHIVLLYFIPVFVFYFYYLFCVIFLFTSPTFLFFILALNQQNFFPLVAVSVCIMALANHVTNRNNNIGHNDDSRDQRN